MTYKEFQAEMGKEKDSSKLQKSFETIRTALAQCPKEEQDLLQSWSGYLDQLTAAASEDEYNAARDGVFQELNKLISDYSAPGALFANQESVNAMNQLFTALELNGKDFDVPGFTTNKEMKLEPNERPTPLHRPTADREKARKAMERDPLAYAAQFMALISYGKQASPKDMFYSLGLLSRWKNNKALQLAAQDSKTMGCLANGDFYGYQDNFESKQLEEMKYTRSFKEYSDMIAKQYREKQISYAVMEKQMKVLRDLAAPQVSQETDPVKRSKLQEQAKIYMPDFLEKLKQLELQERQQRRSVTSAADQQKLSAELFITTTAQDVYNSLTKDYKAGKMTYERYEMRLKTMKDLTNGNKHAKIDLKSIDAVVEVRLQKSAEERITQMLGADAAYNGFLGARLRGIYDVYGLTPKLDEDSVKYKGYTREEFSRLQDFQPKDGETHLTLGESGPTITNDDFAALAVAATQAYPEIGFHFFVMDRKTFEVSDVVTDPSTKDDPSLNDDLISVMRGAYVTDAHQGSQGARVGFNRYIEPTIAPARSKVDEALRAFNGGKGDPKELAKILGQGLHQMLQGFIFYPGDKEVRGDCALEGAIAGRLADIIEMNPTLKKEAAQYFTEDELQTAKGLKTVYELTRAATEAQDKMKASVESKKPIPEPERRACIELLLRQRAMVKLGVSEVAKTFNNEEMEKGEEELLSADRSTEAKDSLASLKCNSLSNKLAGYPDCVKTLASYGPDFAKQLLDKTMPERQFFCSMKDGEILSALNSKFGAKEDPLTSKAYQTTPEEQALETSVMTAQKSIPHPGGKTL